jgi:thioredoxin reductase
VSQVQSDPPSSRDGCAVAIVGAGPYGLAAAAHLRHAGVDVRVLGEPMEFWRKQMPKGMMLRSRKRSSNIAHPQRTVTLAARNKMRGGNLANATLEEFLDYAHWFQKELVPDIDRRKVDQVERDNGGYRLTLTDGEQVVAERVVVAAGLFPFPWRPSPFDQLSPSYASHTSEHEDLGHFADRDVIVVGGGQSALESAALLHEAGARVELIARAPSIRWLAEDSSGRRTLHERMIPPTDVGGRGTGWLAAVPDLFRRLPRNLQPKLAYRCIKPAGASWLLPRLTDVPITTERTVTSVTESGERVVLQLDDDSERTADHVLLGTGYRVDVSRYPFLPPELTESLELSNGYPVLRPGLESSSLPGLHFLGAPAALSFGPIMRFVVGTWYAAPALTHHVLGKRPRFSSSLPVRPWSNGSSG